MVAGKNVSVDPSGYGELINVIVPPRSEQEITIYGPSLEHLPDSATVGLFFFDVVTKTDTAGNVIEKQNFEWYYSYKTQLIEKEVTIPAPERIWMPASQLR